MISSYNWGVDEAIEEVGYRLGVVASLLGKLDMDKEQYLYDAHLRQSTLNQVDFLEGTTLSEDIPVSEYSDAVNLYHDALESILDDLKSNKKLLKCDAIDKYQHIILFLDGMVGAIEHESVSDVPHVLNYMYDVVNRTVK
ncbi:MAG: hypothetical protein KAI18_04145 [Candidatus Aenigmarchaeota archaeon]|nr:hypothetical protein [Candidatus Aenigmarchaeota archaeon]